MSHGRLDRSGKSKNKDGGVNIVENIFSAADNKLECLLQHVFQAICERG
jgi:hypothetical protein